MSARVRILGATEREVTRDTQGFLLNSETTLYDPILINP